MGHIDSDLSDDLNFVYGEWHEKLWYDLNSKYHRLNGPAIECANGSKQWFIDGKKYTEEEFNKKINLVPDNIMKIDADGTKRYYNKDGQLHREDGPAIESPNGNKEWYQNGKLHRADGPAIEWHNGDKEWYINGERHRVEGPAIEYTNGYKEWLVNGIFLDYLNFLFEQYISITQKDKNKFFNKG